ncbi:glycosyltransferase family 4 [Fusarium agapanthi]|uniref:Glycosyltransferase family 4 n=1 Tax=Fusarium agapanthi TaxID=1803897 RepID=A0A9P5BGI0_9HYPO|nr:glycosyltransferase family 4 [Fusarium agapanthi]
MSRIAVVHAAEQLPFGPFAGGLPGHSSTTREADLFQQLDGIRSVSETILKYALEHGQLETRFLVLHPWTYLVGKDHAIPDRVFNWDKKFVGMINPCPLEFLTYMSWGADDATVKDMEELSNMTVCPCCAVEKDLWRDIKVLVVPSLWFEAWGMVVVEAHLRGIPVVSSNAGALSESMLGLDYTIPVTPITGQREESGRYLIPEQDVAPCVKVITKLMQDQSECNSEADIETWLMEVRPEPKT